MDDILKIKEPYSYFQAGVILFNLAEFRKTYTTEEMLRFAASYPWELLDQDVLNYLAQGKYRTIDMAWNVMTDWNRIRIPEIISRAPKYLRDEYMAAHEAPKIIHYAGPDKPWQQPCADYAEVFWKYAKKSPYYEVMLQRLCAQQCIAEQDQRITEREQGLDDIRNSVSFRIGRAITWLPRKIRGGVLCFRDHGVGYTLRRALYHIGLWKDEEATGPDPAR